MPAKTCDDESSHSEIEFLDSEWVLVKRYDSSFGLDLPAFVGYSTSSLIGARVHGVDEVSGSGPISKHPRFVRLGRYLESKARADTLAGRGDIDPIEISDLLPYINLFDVVWIERRLRFRYRLIGTAQAEAFGSDFTGLFIDQVFSADAVKILTQVLGSVVETRQPHFAEVGVPLPDREHVRLYRALYPLAANGRDVDMLIAAYVFASQNENALRLVG